MKKIWDFLCLWQEYPRSLKGSDRQAQNAMNGAVGRLSKQDSCNRKKKVSILRHWPDNSGLIILTQTNHSFRGGKWFMKMISKSIYLHETWVSIVPHRQKCINACQLRVNKRIEPQSAKTSVSLECHHPYVIRKHEVKSSFLWFLNMNPHLFRSFFPVFLNTGCNDR